MPRPYGERLEVCHAGWLVGALLLMCIPLFFGNLGARDLWTPDEPKYGQVVREMLDGGNWLLLQFNGQPYPDKPPLFFWAAAVCAAVAGGVSELTMRMPSAVSACLAIITVFFLGRRLFGQLTGFVAGIVLATSLKFAWQGRYGETDAMLAFFVLAALTAFWFGHTARESGPRWRLLAWAFMGLGTMTKGPVAFLLPLATLVLFFAWRGELRRLREMRFGVGFGILVLLTLPWLLTVMKKGGSGVSEQMLWHHIIVRFFSGFNHLRPPYHYVVRFFEEFAPWSVFAPTAIAVAFLRAPRGFGKQPAMAPGPEAADPARRDWALREGWAFLLAWFLAMLVFFSLSPTKQGVYILPLYPSAAVMVARVLVESIGKPQGWESKTVRVASVILFAGVILASVAAVVGYAYAPAVVGETVSRNVVAGFAACLSLVALAGVVLLSRRAAAYALTTFALLAYVAQVGLHAGLLHRLDAIKSAKPLCQKTLAVMKPEDGWAIYGMMKPAYVFYTGRTALVLHDKDPEVRTKVRAFFSSDRRVFCVMKRSELQEVQDAAGRPLTVAVKHTVGKHSMVVASNSP